MRALTRTMRWGWMAGLAVALSAATLSAQTLAPLAPDQIKMKVERKMAREDALRGIDVSVQGDVVTLNGTVPSLWAKEKAIKDARKVDSVATVVSNLMIPAAENDQVVANQVFQVFALHDQVCFAVLHQHNSRL